MEGRAPKKDGLLDVVKTIKLLDVKKNGRELEIATSSPSNQARSSSSSLTLTLPFPILSPWIAFSSNFSRATRRRSRAQRVVRFRLKRHDNEHKFQRRGVTLFCLALKPA